MSGVSITWRPPMATLIAKYDDMADRTEDLRPPFEDALDLLERVHKRGFARLHGDWVDTGRVMNSLTSSGPGSIREAERDEMTFGSSVHYAPYLTKRDSDPELGQIKNQGKGRHAVLFFPKTTQKQIAKLIIGHITEPFEGP